MAFKKGAYHNYGVWYRLFVFLKRIRHCAGFGVQSPTDYAFVREVIYERWPYALYAELEAKFHDTNWFLLKLSQLLLRVSNYAQASRIGIIGPLPPVMEAHLKAGTPVEVFAGPLKGLTGKLVRSNKQYFLLKEVPGMGVMLKVTRWCCRAIEE